jgi:hypothetical protein
MLVACAMAGVLLWAGLEKARDPRATASTIRSLGARKAARPAAVVLAGVEIALGFCLVFTPHSSATQLGVTALAATFALAGSIALSREEPIRCSCFGAGGNGYLGWNQVLAFPVWLGGAAALRLWMPEAPPPHVSATGLAALALGIAGARALQVARARDGARGDRRSAHEMIAWLR